MGDRNWRGGYQTADRLPQVPRAQVSGVFWAGVHSPIVKQVSGGDVEPATLCAGDFADFHQRFSLVPRRCAGKYPPAAREISGHVRCAICVTQARYFGLDGAAGNNARENTPLLPVKYWGTSVVRYVLLKPAISASTARPGTQNSSEFSLRT